MNNNPTVIGLVKSGIGLRDLDVTFYDKETDEIFRKRYHKVRKEDMDIAFRTPDPTQFVYRRIGMTYAYSNLRGEESP